MQEQVPALRDIADDLMWLGAAFPDLQDEAVALRAKVCEKLRTLDDVPDEEDGDDGEYDLEVFAEAAEDYRRGQY